MFFRHLKGSFEVSGVKSYWLLLHSKKECRRRGRLNLQANQMRNAQTRGRMWGSCHAVLLVDPIHLVLIDCLSRRLQQRRLTLLPTTTATDTMAKYPRAVVQVPCLTSCHVSFARDRLSSDISPRGVRLAFVTACLLSLIQQPLIPVCPGLNNRRLPIG